MWINNYPELITESTESEQDLLDREKPLRGSALESRLKMLRLLKTGVYRSQLRLAKALGYSPRQLRRWWKTYYREGGLEALLEEDKARGGKKERINQEALDALEERMKAGEIARLEEARRFLPGGAVWHSLRRGERTLSPLRASPDQAQDRTAAPPRSLRRRTSGF